jgi:hypothetical protein
MIVYFILVSFIIKQKHCLRNFFYVGRGNITSENNFTRIVLLVNATLHRRLGISCTVNTGWFVNQAVLFEIEMLRKPPYFIKR